MKIVLVKDIKKLGFSGDVIEVASGYARNYLFPKRFAVEANVVSLQNARVKQEARIKSQDEMAAKAQEIVKELEGVTLTFTKKVTKAGHLYGSVGEKDIAAELKKTAKIDLEKSQVEMKDHIKELGSHEVTIHLPGGVMAFVKVEIKADASAETKEKKETKKDTAAKK